jgi:hypothetical protein
MIVHGHQEFIAAEPTLPERLNDLAEALLYEAQVIEELRQALLRQRAGVATDDPQLVEASIHAMGRTLLTLDEAKRRRTALTALIAGGEAIPLDQLESILGGSLPREVAEARSLLKRGALLTAQDVAINQHVLRRALEAGDTFLQKLFSMAGDPPPGYPRRDPAREPAAPSGVILNRMA